MKKNIFILLLFYFVVIDAQAQQFNDRLSLEITVLNAANKEKLEYANIVLKGLDRTLGSISDYQGKSKFKNLPKGNYRIKVYYLGFQTYEKDFVLTESTSLNVFMVSDSKLIKEVVITATESKESVSSTSVIDKKAMQHLQPSSFSDLLELLPGGYSKPPSLSGVNTIKIRQVGISSDDHNTGALGTSFVIDGAPVSNDANLQYTPEQNNTDERYRNVNSGLDMRNISTDQIEKVEIIRGVPSVQYGDLTSGVVNIQRKIGYTPWEARMKSDGVSKLFYVGKGLDLKKDDSKLYFGLDFLDSRDNPVDLYQNFKRVTGSARYRKLWKNDDYHIKWEPTLDFYNNIDNYRYDPDVDYKKAFKYKSTRSRYSFAQNFTLKSVNKSILNQLVFKSSLAYHKDEINQTKYVFMKSPTYISNFTEEGEHIASYAPANWISNLRVDGKPLNAFAQLFAVFKQNIAIISNKLTLGAEWKYDKNFGMGHIYDLETPPSSSLRSRPIVYKDIQSNNKLSFFVEESLRVPIGEYSLLLVAGVRTTNLICLGKEYKMSNKIFWDPRVNLVFYFKPFKISDKLVKTSFSASSGWNTKFPTLMHLFPVYDYIDIEQLNYYHNNKDFRLLSVMVYKRLPVNYDIMPARNWKLDLRLNIELEKNNLSISYFNEKMNSGFRSTISDFEKLSYKKFDVSGIDHSALSSPLSLEELPYEIMYRLNGIDVFANASKTINEGVELSLQTKRFDKIHTRLSVSGAWIKSTYYNSQPIYKSKIFIVANKSHHLFAKYEIVNQFTRELLNTNFMFDTYIPVLDLEVSTSIQCFWRDVLISKGDSPYPLGYIDEDGKYQKYTEELKNDPILGHLNMGSLEVNKMITPSYLNINLKASKTFFNKLRVALFVNNVATYRPKTHINNVNSRFVPRRDPYFGMEINLKL